MIEKTIKKVLSNNSKKKNISLTSQCRISFLFLLKYLKEKNPNKNEIIFCAYNLPEMINVASNLNFNIVFCDLDYETGYYNLNKLKKKISKKTLAVVLTNMFNTYDQSMNLKRICNVKKITLIEDNAIYFDNFKIDKNGKKFYSGSIGDFSIYSFNIMKNISALYGGAVASNLIDFHLYLNKKSKDLKKFNKILLFKQIIIFSILKIMTVKYLYKNIFFTIIKNAHNSNNKILLKLFYPLLKFKIIKFPKYYFTKISSLSKKLIFFQLIQSKIRISNHKKRKLKNIYYYKKIKNSKVNQIKTVEIKDFNYQNFIDFPLLVKNRLKLNKFLLEKGIETRFYYYKNCEKIFRKKRNLTCINSEKFENEILCLPNHKNISLEYIDYIIKMISIFYSYKLNQRIK